MIAKVVFRADASSEMGSGHVLRCLTLADHLRAHGARTMFVSRYLPESLVQRIVAQGHDLVRLAPDTSSAAPCGDLGHSAWLGTSQEADAVQTLSALDGICDVLVVDHYALDRRWESAVRASAGVVMAIDDLADRSHDCDILLDQNYYADLDTRYLRLVPSDTQCLLGPEYALLRPEFTNQHAEEPAGERIFVSAGGNDRFSLGERVADAIRLLGRASLGAEIVVGAGTAQLERAREAADGLAGVHVHGFVNGIAALMKKCTVAVGAAGSSTWERCAVGLPSLVVVTADNQRRMALDLAGKRIVTLLGDVQDLTAPAIAEALSELLNDPPRRSEMSRESRELVDGRGANRVADHILRVRSCTN